MTTSSTIHTIHNNTVEHWTYLNAGNKSVTFYCNSNTDYGKNKVLKLNIDVIQQLHDHKLTYEQALHSIQIDVQYHNQLTQLLNSNTTQQYNTAETCIVETQLVQILLKQCTKHLNISNIHNVTQYIPAILMTDATICTETTQTTNTDSNVTLCIEIKPKWLNIQCYDDLPESMRTSDTAVCRYCMHQQYKQHCNNNATDRGNKYCPLMLLRYVNITDLQNAVNGLVQSKHCNLFVRYNDALHHIHESAAVQKLLCDKLQLIHTDDRIVEKLLEQLLLDGTSLLNEMLIRIQLIQRVYTTCSLQMLHSIYHQTTEHGAIYMHSDVINDTDIALLHNVEDTQLHMQRCNHNKWHRHGSIVNDTMHVDTTIPTYEQQFALDTLRRYMIAKTCKDLSIMIAVKFEPSAPRHKTCITDTLYISNIIVPFQYSIQCIDLDRKSIHKIPYYVQQNTDINNYFVQNFAYTANS